MKPIKITEEIKLYPIQLYDAQDVFNTINTQREYLGKWLPFIAFTNEIKDTEEFIKSVINAPEESKELVFVIRFNEEFAGIIGYRGTDLLNKKTEIGYWLSEYFQGKGIVTKSVERLIEYTFNDLGMNRLQIRCAVENEKSKKIPKALGFKFEGIERAGELLSNGTFTDLEVYSLLAKELE